jgi:Leucine-rich repeat (LRR) protein
MSSCRVNSCVLLGAAILAVLLFSNPGFVRSGQQTPTQDPFLEACGSSDQSKRQLVDALIAGLNTLSGDTSKQSCESYELRLKEIKSIRLRAQSITDISALGSFPQIKFLDLSNNRISDISVLSSMTHLTNLWIPVNEISDLRPLSNLKYIEELRASKNSVKDLTPLAKLDTLSSISISYNQIEDITALGSLDSLKLIIIGHNKIVNISELLTLPELKRLFANDNRIRDVDTKNLSKRVRPDPSAAPRRLILIDLAGNPLSEEAISSLESLLEDNFRYKAADAYHDKSFSEQAEPEIKLLREY